MRAVAHSIVLSSLNLLGVWVGFLVFSVFEPADQRGIQSVVALIVTLGGYLTWSRFARRWRGRGLGLHGWTDGRWVFGLAFGWAAVVFVPLHYVTQGYLTSFGNIAALGALQAVTNGISIAAAVGVPGMRRVGPLIGDGSSRG